MSTAYSTDPNILDALVVGSLDPGFNPTRNIGVKGLMTPQRGYFYVKKMTFVNYGSGGAIGACPGCMGGELLL